MANRPALAGPVQRAACALGICAAGLLLASAPLAHLAWLALCAPALGCLTARAGLAPAGALLPLVWAVPLWLAQRELPPAPHFGLCALAGLFALGLGLGALSARPLREVWRPAGALLLLTLALTLAPARASLARDPWPPAVARTLLDLSPTALVLECSGVDWMRHPLVYEPVGSDRFERRAWSGALAGPTLLLVGYLFAAAAHVAARRLATRA
jgi:hypothetical protein